jgi:hypothetical protein
MITIIIKQTLGTFSSLKSHPELKLEGQKLRKLISLAH